MFSFQGLWQGTVVMYDRGTKSEWLHLLGNCVNGSMKGGQLDRVPSRHVLWSEWKRDHPNTDIMAITETSPTFSGEDAQRGTTRLPPRFAALLKDVHNRIQNSELVYGVEHNGEARAYPFQPIIRARTVINDVLAEAPIVVGVNPTTSSPFGYHRMIDGNVLSFEWDAHEQLFERTTGSIFNESGAGISGPLAGRQLKPVVSMQSAWYGWYASRLHTKGVVSRSPTLRQHPVRSDGRAMVFCLNFSPRQQRIGGFPELCGSTEPLGSAGSERHCSTVSRWAGSDWFRKSGAQPRQTPVARTRIPISPGPHIAPSWCHPYPEAGPLPPG